MMLSIHLLLLQMVILIMMMTSSSKFVSAFVDVMNPISRHHQQQQQHLVATSVTSRHKRKTMLHAFGSSSSSDMPTTLMEFPIAQQLFPGSMPYPTLLQYISNVLTTTLGYNLSTTLVATSLCGDELNRPLEKQLSDLVGSPNYSLGGLAGCPFGGATAFKKMKLHIPDQGQALIVFGPHVGVDVYGNLGRVQERSQIQSETRQSDDHLWCCRSAILACHHVRQQQAAIAQGQLTPQAENLFNPMDMSQQFVQSMLMPYAPQLEQAAQSGGDNGLMYQLPQCLFAAQQELMQRIIQDAITASQQSSQSLQQQAESDIVPADFPGNVAVLGGIQINTPQGYYDYFQPLQFDAYNSQGNYLGSLLQQQ